MFCASKTFILCSRMCIDQHAVFCGQLSLECYSRSDCHLSTWTTFSFWAKNLFGGWGGWSQISCLVSACHLQPRFTCSSIQSRKCLFFLNLRALPIVAKEFYRYYWSYLMLLGPAGIVSIKTVESSGKDKKWNQGAWQYQFAWGDIVLIELLAWDCFGNWGQKRGQRSRCTGILEQSPILFSFHFNQV